MEYGLIGEHLSHSFSKEIHAKLAGYEYEICEISRENLADFLEKRRFRAINVTIPYKEAVIPYLYYIDGSAKAIGAVNTVVNRDGRLYGYNTDFYGMTELINRAEIGVFGKKVLILGTGGTSKTAAAVAKSLGAREIIRVSRSGKDGAVSYSDAVEKHADADVIINTTPCGMFPNAGEAPIEIERFSSLSGVVDVIYNPLRTKLYSQAKKRGIKAVCGLYMLVAQAVRAVEIFTDCALRAGETERVYAEIEADKENVVLVGMPGVGKTTVGKLLSAKLGKTFVDTDDEITKSTGRTPAEIIRADGEAEFRRIESEVISRVASATSAVIATGGGAVLSEANVMLLKQNGRLVFLERPIDEITAMDNRPLTSSVDALRQKYAERLPIYTSCADCRVDIYADDEKSADAIIMALYGGKG